MAKYTIHYSLKGEITIEASSSDEAAQNFHDRCGCSTDEIYENVWSESVDIVKED